MTTPVLSATRQAPLAEKGVITPEDIKDLSAITAKVQNGQGAIFDPKRATIFVSSTELQVSLGLPAQGMVLTKTELQPIVDSINAKPEQANRDLFKVLAAQGVIEKDAEGKFVLTEKGQNSRTLIVALQDSAKESVCAYMHEKRHLRFFDEPTFQSEVLAKVTALPPEQRMLGLIIMQLSGSYELLTADPRKSERFQFLATELDAYAHMPTGGFDVTQFGIRPGRNFKDSVTQISDALKRHLQEQAEVLEEAFSPAPIVRRRRVPVRLKKARKH